MHRAPWWLPGGHAQTIVAARLLPLPAARYRRERWDTPDGDFVDVDWLEAPAAAADAPLLVLFHGLEGSSQGHYARAFAHWAAARGWRYAVPHFRGCSGEINRAPRAYHSGDYEEVGWLLARLRATQPPAARMFAVGISLGGNALARYLEEAGAEAGRLLEAAAAISAPLDLEAAGLAIEGGFNRISYTPMFLATMKPKALQKLKQYPQLFQGDRVQKARTLREFDDAFTAPLHGYADVWDYWRRASAAPQLARIRVPTLLVNAANDPFVPAACLPPPGPLVGAPQVRIERPAHGGHCGFAEGALPPGRLDYLPRRVARFFEQGC
jgi:predicted alpha/beta-fold hydrolase